MTDRRRRCLFALLLAVVGIVTGCTTTIVPPPVVEPADRAQVIVADYGYHSTLIFPNATGTLTEYAYGDWDYFAHNKKSVCRALQALFWSDQATLGRRTLTQPATAPSLGAASVIAFDVPRDKVRDLERALDARYQIHIATMFFSEAQQLHFVKDDEHYAAWNNCNQFTARRLEELGCEIRGLALTSKFEVAKEDVPSSRPTTPTTRPSPKSAS